ncbi:hypothetical protein BKA70DRAFT_1233672 [Coprinopsis sp. MPI-PUGE-AT-0042]|nr:hypothetical protein BKA70DRAFT_1233672 [Coprinopsis sp. MPI-PUGE-AT-0042]
MSLIRSAGTTYQSALAFSIATIRPPVSGSGKWCGSQPLLTIKPRIASRFINSENAGSWVSHHHCLRLQGLTMMYIMGYQIVMNFVMWRPKLLSLRRPPTHRSTKSSCPSNRSACEDARPKLGPWNDFRSSQQPQLLKGFRGPAISQLERLLGLLVHQHKRMTGVLDSLKVRTHLIKGAQNLARSIEGERCLGRTQSLQSSRFANCK